MISDLALKSVVNYLHAQNGVDLGSIKIVKAQSQLVAGVNLKLDIDYT